MMSYYRSFSNLEELDSWIKSIRDKHPGCLDYVEIGKPKNKGAGYFDCQVTVYPEFKREQSPLGGDVPPSKDP
jgi:hypothetical protein